MQGYKEFTVHMSSFHGGLDMVMAMDAREEVGFRMTKNINLNSWVANVIQFVIPLGQSSNQKTGREDQQGHRMVGSC